MQPEVKNFTITCKKCGKSSRLAIIDNKQVMYKDHQPIIAARLRPDMNWGFECICGNDSRVAPEEKDNLEVLVQGGEHSIARIAKTLARRNELRFEMELA